MFNLEQHIWTFLVHLGSQISFTGGVHLFLSQVKLKTDG
ncbi:hypothetical protein MiSe_08810 [Microseira wollei NIES-4236]|uniref:Transposase n=1 Tax=Microseira wollei NIES-4236 TaxID=2530354 RepID=A0AAV3X4C4_9CYAN|nr:hypothetical protein MiSe_08810 [Microseira wollei NIES-4236]